MNKVKLAFIATVSFLFLACESKKTVDFSIIPVKGSNGEYQYIDMNQKGKIIINPQFSEAHIFRDGLALVKTSGKDGKWGYIDKEGKFAIAPTYNMAQHFSENMAWVQIENQPPMLIDKEGKMLLQIDSLMTATPFNNGSSTITVYSQGQEFVKLIDKKGETVTVMEDFSDIKAKFDYVGLFIDEMAVVKSGEKWGAVDKKGNFIINLQYDDLDYDSDGLFIVQVGKKYGWINKKNEMVINLQYDEVGKFAGNKLAPVKMSNKWAYIDKKGQVIINLQFDEAYSFNGDYAMIVNAEKIGFIDKKGNFIVPPLYDLDVGNILEYIFGLTQNVYNLPVEYFLLDENVKFLHYAKQFEKRETETAKKEVKEETKDQIVHGTLTDSRDNQKYKIVNIGTQVWMAENLNYATGGKCYDGEAANCKKYGRLYNWNSAMKACPSGWHLPNDIEWYVLMTAVGGTSIAGKHLKSKLGWNHKLWDNKKSGNGLDIYNFTALSGGYGSDDNFNEVGSGGYWWSSSESGNGSAILLSLSSVNEEADWSYPEKKLLVNVRCVQNLKDDKEFKNSIVKNSYNFPIASNTKFLPYAKLDERMEVYIKKIKEELIVAIAADPTPAISELEQEAKVWQKSLFNYKAIEGRFFLFASRIYSPPEDYEGGGDYGGAAWKATSKMKIGDCPTGSIWIMHNAYDDGGTGWGNKISPKCRFLTPKVITSYKGENGP